MKDSASFKLVPRSGEMVLSFGTSSSGDDARTSSVPFGKLAANGGNIFLPKALKLSIQASSDIPLNGDDVVCQAYKDAQGTQPLGSTFTQSKAAEIGPEPVSIGSIFCSDAGAVKARTGSDDSSAQTSSTPTQSTQAQAVGTPSMTRPGSSAATSLDYDTTEPTTIQQTSSSKPKSSTSKVSSSSTSATAATTSPLPAGPSPASAAAAQTTSGAGGLHTPNNWTVKRIFNISVLAACYAAWFIL